MSADSLQRLMALTPAPDRAERVRARCRTELAQRARYQPRTAAIADFAWRVLAPAVVGAFGVLYLAVVVATTLRLEGVF
jgi:hypothetical protein